MTIDEMLIANKAFFVGDMISFDIISMKRRQEFNLNVSSEEFSKSTMEILFKYADEFGMFFIVKLMSILNVAGFEAKPKFEKGNFVALIVDGFEFKR